MIIPFFFGNQRDILQKNRDVAEKVSIYQVRGWVVCTDQ